MNFTTLLNEARAILSSCTHIDNPGLEVRLLFCHIFHLDTNGFMNFPRDCEIDEDTAGKLRLLVEQRADGKSIASLTKRKGFYDLDFHVNEHVLIPRPDTEILVEYAINLINEKKLCRGLDIGTGPGTIGLTLLSHNERLTMDLLDVSSEASQLCAVNAKSLNIDSSRYKLVKADIRTFSSGTGYDFIVSNPPYIPSDTVTDILEKHEADDPRLTLDGGSDGLDFYRHISLFAQKTLRNYGYIIFEHGYDQKEKLREIYTRGDFSFVTALTDYGGNDRVSVFQKG